MKTIEKLLDERIMEGVAGLRSPAEIINAEHDRTDGWAFDSNFIPRTQKEFDELSELDEETLKKYGCQLFSDENKSADGRFLWLYPKEWYDHIPNNTKIISIFFKKSLFEHGVTSSSARFGALGFGFLKK